MRRNVIFYLSPAPAVKQECSLLIEEKMKLCEKVAELSESQTLKEREVENLKREMEKRMGEVAVYEKQLDVSGWGAGVGERRR